MWLSNNLHEISQETEERQCAYIQILLLYTKRECSQKMTPQEMTKAIRAERQQQLLESISICPLRKRRLRK